MLLSNETKVVLEISVLIINLSPKQIKIIPKFWNLEKYINGITMLKLNITL